MSKKNSFNQFANYTLEQYESNLYGLKDRFPSYSDYINYRDKVKAKIRETKIKRYGSENCGFGSDNYKQSMIDKFGCENPNRCSEVIAKRKQTNLIKYGNEWGNVDKRRDNYKNRTGYENPYSNPEVIKKRSEDYFKKTGYYYPGQNPEVKAKIEETRISNIPYLEYNESRPLYLHTNGRTSSKFEILIDNLILNEFPDLNVRFNDRTHIINQETNRHLELDIFIPSLNKAIEIGSKYYHKDKQRDEFKISECDRLGIDLLTIDYDEYNLDKDNYNNKIIEFIKSPNKFVNLNT